MLYRPIKWPFKPSSGSLWFTCLLPWRQVDACKSLFTEWHRFTRGQPFCQFTENPTCRRISWKLRVIGLSKQWNPMVCALQSHMVTEWLTCVVPWGPRSCTRSRWSRRSTPRQGAGCMCAQTAPHTRQRWIGKIITTLPWFLKTPASTRDHKVRTTALRRASTWADRSTPSTHRRLWEPWSRPASLTLPQLTVYLCGRIQVFLSSTTRRGSSSSLSRMSQVMETRRNRANITYHSPGWKPPNPTHTPGRASGQVILHTAAYQEMLSVYDHNYKSHSWRVKSFHADSIWLDCSDTV